MNKIIYTLALTSSILGASAEDICPAELSQDQMKALVDKGQIEIKTVKFTTQDQAIIKGSLPGKLNFATKMANKSAHREVENHDTNTGIVHCSYQFRTLAQKATGEDHQKFTISTQVQPARPTIPLPPK